MPRYAVIDMYSGFIWGVTDAPDAVAACRLVVTENTGDENHFCEVAAGEVLENDFAVHEVASDFDVYDGQNPDEIAAVTARPLAGFVRVTAAENWEDWED